MPDSQSIFKRACVWSLVLYLTLNGNGIAVHGFKSGSPLQACADMVPAHHVDAQTSASPFVTTPSLVSTFINFFAVLIQNVFVLSGVYRLRLGMIRP
jgi:hypothetical protein